MTGSFNFTKAAEEKNAENLLIIRDKEAIRSCVAVRLWVNSGGNCTRKYRAFPLRGGGQIVRRVANAAT